MGMVMKKTAQNDVTGDWLQSKPNNEMFEQGWDRIFGKKKKEESRIDVVGQNGNEGLHYEYQLNKSTGEVERVDNGTTTSTQE
jgi:hypothetical protein